jgi:membrane fusion protein, heavy metal efflux system
MGTTTRLQKPSRLGPLGLALALAWPVAALVWAPTAFAQLPPSPPTKTALAPALATPQAATAGSAGSLVAPKAAARPTVGCLIGPEATADIGSPVTGLVSVVAVDRGDTVRTGQTLIQLENDVERSSLEAARSRATMDSDIRSAEANLTLAKQRFARGASLVQQGFASPQTMEQLQAERDVAEQKLHQARTQKNTSTHEMDLVKAQLNQRSLKSPFNGVVVERFISPGERAEDKPLLRLAMLDPLRVELVMPAARWGSVARGDSIPIVPELPGASAVTARVTHIDKMLDAASNTFRVRLALANPGNRMPAGARCRVEGAAGTVATVPATNPSAAVQPAANSTQAPAPKTAPRI